LADWSLLTNHGRLLLAIENEPGLRVRDMAERLGLSERGVSLVLRDLREGDLRHVAPRGPAHLLQRRPREADAHRVPAGIKLVDLLDGSGPIVGGR
jgi:DNA-binding MarR family transcriptional regulator